MVICPVLLVASSSSPLWRPSATGTTFSCARNFGPAESPIGPNVPVDARPPVAVGDIPRRLRCLAGLGPLARGCTLIVLPLRPLPLTLVPPSATDRHYRQRHQKQAPGNGASESVEKQARRCPLSISATAQGKLGGLAWSRDLIVTLSTVQRDPAGGMLMQERSDSK